MSSKSISPTLPPQVGSGFFSHTPSEWSRSVRIQSGSLFMWEIISTISRSRPLRDLNAYLSSGSWNPNWHWSRSVPIGCVTTMMHTPPGSALLNVLARVVACPAEPVALETLAQQVIAAAVRDHRVPQSAPNPPPRGQPVIGTVEQMAFHGPPRKAKPLTEHDTVRAGRLIP